MNTLRPLSVSSLALMLALGACAADETASSQGADHTEGVLGFAPALAYGQTVTGQVASPQLDVWAIDVAAGDRLRLTKTVTSGDLRPDIVVFQGAGASHVPSSSYEVTATSLTKDYVLDRHARYFVVVRGYDGQGAGSYALSATCLGGPCAGQTPPSPVVDLEDAQRQACIQQARVCAVTKLPEHGGAVGAVRAQQIFDECLGRASVKTDASDVPASCGPACQGEVAGEVCQAIVGLLPWLADQVPACIGAFNDCVESCYDAGDDQATTSVEYGGEAVCVGGEAAFNGSCGDVRDLQICGGRWAAESCEACYLGCHASTGAWIDDLDTLCSEQCDCELSDDF